MHGRSCLLILLFTLALAATASADARFTAACSASWDCLTPGDRALADGVIVRWRAQANTPETVQLRTIQRLSGGGQATTGTSAAETVAPGAVRQFAARVPIAHNGELAVSGTTAVEADVESDADGDGYGDTTQDACPEDAGDHEAPCGATRTFGSPLHLQPDTAGLSSSGNPTDALQVSGGGRIQAPADGVITRWRFRAGPPAPGLALQVLHPAASGAYTVGAQSPAATPAGAGAVTTVDARLAVKAGDRLGLSSPGDLGAVAQMPATASQKLALFPNPAPTAGQTATPQTTTHDFRLLVQADVEPDADGDGYGDLTQDVCPFDAARHAGCSADLAVTSTFSSRTVAPGGDAFFELWVTNHGPDPAQDVVLRVTLPPRTILDGNVAPCPQVDGVAECRVARLDPGDATATRFYATGDPGTTATAVATATATTPDPDLADNTLAWTATFASRAQPPPALPKPCANVVRGTRDDDVLRGTQFGDRLLGGDGSDLIKALGGDDCLEGGAATDVLDGADGADRLNGASGRDRLYGVAGDDRLTGGLGNDRLIGGPGNDTLLPGVGRDSISAGGGKDTINARDGVSDTIDCGAGTDTVRADRRDRLKGCETVTRR